MGILVDGLAICLGGLFGSKLHRLTGPEDHRILGIGIMIVSLVGFFENMYYVAGLQLLIFLAARLSASVFHEDLTMQLCAIGYILLFFSGLNLTTDGKSRISNINMLPGMLPVILFHILRQAMGVFL